MAKTPPTERQLEILQWIADGCPEGPLSDPKFKASAYALDSRNLVRVRSRKNPWDVEITDAGKQLLAGAPLAMTPQVNAPHPRNDDMPPAEAPSVTEAVRRPVSVRIPTPPTKSATEEMMERLLVEHVIEFPREETGRYKRLVTVAKRKKLFPDDMELVVTTSWSKACTVELKCRPEWQLATLDPIEVPAAIRTPHSVVSKLKQARSDRLSMDGPLWNWTLRLVQGLAAEAEGRGYGVEAVPASQPAYYGHQGRQPQKTGHVVVSIGEDEVDLHFSQATKRVPRHLTASDLRRQSKGYAVLTEESSKTDFLIIRVWGLEPAFWRSEWTETDTARADSFLPRIIQEIELRAARAVERRLEAQHRDDEKRRKWEQVRDRAIQRLNENHRAKVLLDQAERFQQVQLIGEYIAAVKVQMRALPTGDADAACRWVEWAEAHATAINPLLGPLGMPDDPNPGADAIKPYMEGWSPYRPERTLGAWG